MESSPEFHGSALIFCRAFWQTSFSQVAPNAYTLRHFCLAEVFLLGGAFVPTGTSECQKLLNFLSKPFVRRFGPRSWWIALGVYVPGGHAVTPSLTTNSVLLLGDFLPETFDIPLHFDFCPSAEFDQVISAHLLGLCAILYRYISPQRGRVSCLAVQRHVAFSCTYKDRTMSNFWRCVFSVIRRTKLCPIFSCAW